jgi:hypothetical protein
VYFVPNSRMAAAAAAVNDSICPKIINKIQERFLLSGLESLASIKENDTFLIKLSKKDNPKEEVAHASGYLIGGNLYLDTLHRYGFGYNNSSKGAGLLLLDLVSCFAAKNNQPLSLSARPDCGGTNIKNNSMRLYNFYECAGHKATDPEVKNGAKRWKIFTTNANTLRRALQSRYKGGKRTRRKRK